MINIETLQTEIDKTRYWDMSIFDIQSHYFGDEVYIYTEENANVCWKISFFSCYKVTYETDVNLSFREDFPTKKMTYRQLSYTGQDITLQPFKENDNFIECVINFHPIYMTIVCKDISVEKLKRSDLSFFWEKNK